MNKIIKIVVVRHIIYNVIRRLVSNLKRDRGLVDGGAKDSYFKCSMEKLALFLLLHSVSI